MRALSTISSVLLITVCSTGCLQKTLVNTVYISPSAVVVSIMETDVRSDKPALWERLAEEHDFVLDVNAGNHSTAQDLRELGGRSIRTAWIRRERPYGIVTEAQFSDLRALALAVIRAGETSGNATMTRTGCETAFEIWLNAGHADADDIGFHRLVLTEGHFTMADGFRLEDDNAVAVPDGKKAVDGIVTLRLRWIDEGCQRE